jgi:hypothetical protein
MTIVTTEICLNLFVFLKLYKIFYYWQVDIRHGPFFENIFFEKFEKPLPFFAGYFSKNSKNKIFRKKPGLVWCGKI